MSIPRVLTTGGAGYIGSHVAVELMTAGMQVLILDNFENSDPSVVARIAEITGRLPELVEADVRDRAALERLFGRQRIDAVIHLAGKKCVAESVADPLLYYAANLDGAVSLLRAMRDRGVNRLVFSSSASVYGVPESLPINETARTGPLSPYADTKLIIERIIDAELVARPALAAVSLRYFNPVGAHSSGLIGEDPLTEPTNLFPVLARAAIGASDAVKVFGDDYPTPDGTGIRDFIHVADLARGHVAAVRRLLEGKDTAGRHDRFNLGTGKGYTVLEAIAAFSAAAGTPVPYRVAPRRPGDIVASVADPSRAASMLGWRARRGLEAMCADHWAYASRRMRTGVQLAHAG
jgi:UDP-glucose 4-epimerase